MQCAHVNEIPRARAHIMPGVFNVHLFESDIWRYARRMISGRLLHDKGPGLKYIQLGLYQGQINPANVPIFEFAGSKTSD